MKVLMFGWEFPPHISGGLGTACAGLTQALGNAQTDVIFVVPKLYNGEHADRTTFINASDVPVRQKKLTRAEKQSPAASRKSGDRPSGPNIITTQKGNQTLVEVPALLVPYTDSYKNHSRELRDWSYRLPDKDNPAVRENTAAEYNQEGGQESKTFGYVKEPYAFSGAYGANLLEEVKRYAQVGCEISRRHHFDVIHAHDWMTYPAGIAAKRCSGRPLVVHVHATEVDRSGAHVNPEIFAIEREGMQLADRVVVVSNWTRNIAIQHYQVDENKIVVIHNGISQKDSIVSSLAAPPLHSPIVTFLGRVTRQKGPAYFVEAARKVHERIPHAHFVVAGSGDQLPDMIERIAQLKLSKNFHFTGFLERADIDRIWAMSDVYVMPSVSEPFGIAPLEAIQAGVPVILSRQAGVSEVMPHAMKIDFWNTEALAEAICSVLLFRSLANTLRKNGTEEIKRITWDKAARKLITLYDELDSTQKKYRPLFSGPPTEKASATAVL